MNNLGIARDLQDRHADAQAAYRQALGINPDYVAAKVNLALSLAMSGRGREALPMIEPLAQAPGSARKVRHDYAAVLALSGRQGEAEKVLGADLSHAEVRQFLADLRARPDRLADGRTPPPAVEVAVPAAAGAMAVEPVAAGPAASSPAASSPAAASPVPASPEPVRPTNPGTLPVQLGALPSEAAARRLWADLRRRLPDLLAEQEPVITEVQRGARTVWRLRTGGFADAGQAAGFCARLRALAVDCVVGNL